MIFFLKQLRKGSSANKKFAETLQEELPDLSNKHFSLDSALSRAWSKKDDNLILYILYRIELLRREKKNSSYKPLNFVNLKIQERIASPLSGVNYLATESIGNITPLSSEPDDNWDSFTIECKQKLLPKLAPDLELSTEIVSESAWRSNPETQIMARTNGFVIQFQRDLETCFDESYLNSSISYVKNE